MSMSATFFQGCIVFLSIWLTMQNYAPQYPHSRFAYHGSPDLHKGLNPLCTVNSPENCGIENSIVDKRKISLRPLEGGGTPVLVDHSKRCSNGFLGAKPHPQQQQYYYVCQKDNVVFAKCANLEYFNASTISCQPHLFLSYFQPVCTQEGRFPIPHIGSYYYRCNGNMEPRVFSCPSSQTFSPFLNTCIPNMVNVPTLIAENSVSLPKYCDQNFPKCTMNGTFPSPFDCSFYFTCDLKNNNIFLQTRYQCPVGSCFDSRTKRCACTTPSPEKPMTTEGSFSTTEFTTESEDTRIISTETTTNAPTTTTFSTTPTNIYSTESPTSTISDLTTQTESTDFFSTSTPNADPSTTLGYGDTTFADTANPVESTTLINVPYIPELGCDDGPVDQMQVLVFKWPLDIEIKDCSKEPCPNNMFAFYSNDDKAVGVNWNPV